ncbi:hypothetical protein OG206_15240 [Streptomyces sp. NBC_01341]|uniref:hypothetical protein n=1 Tax=Streptomyces sp. NBC_01341 TaxID=2903831 RepID=UPI002E0D94B9|nr:hypothetical protein OG206_15240 [Streptomyces sp. NBC_01341]
MRLRTTLAAATGVLALSAAVAPLAHADDHGTTTINRVVVNDGQPVVIGNSPTSIPFSVTFSDTTGTDGLIGYVDLWHASPHPKTQPGGSLLGDWENVDCHPVDATTVTCDGTVPVEPQEDVLRNYLADDWNVAVNAGSSTVTSYSTVQVKREAKLQAGVVPTAKAGKYKLRGSLTRADWESGASQDYGNRPVKLQFRKEGGTKYSTVDTFTTNDAGLVTTTVKPTEGGSYRWSFAGNASTGAATSTDLYFDGV